jgi:hypothetical protein
LEFTRRSTKDAPLSLSFNQWNEAKDELKRKNIVGIEYDSIIGV